jgi:putative transposase
VKYAWIDKHEGPFTIARMCRLLGVSRTGFHQWRVRDPSARELANAALDAKVAASHAASNATYGKLRIVKDLRTQGVAASHERVRKSLKRQQLRPVYKKRYRVTTDSEHTKPIAPNVLDRRFYGWKPNQAWVADITYIATAEGWLYLACVIDLASRKVVGWAMSNRINAELVNGALTMAFWQRKPPPGLIMHTDRGSQYASDSYARLIKQYKMVHSMSRRANCWDNSAMESFFKTLKVEQVYRLRYENRAEAKLDIVNWIEGFYNRARLHSTIGYQSPVEFEQSFGGKKKSVR